MQTTTNGPTAFSAATAFLTGHPRRASVSARWMPVYIEPITHSGERITVAIAITTDLNGDSPRVVNTLHSESLRSVFGRYGDHLYALADSITCELQAWLAVGGKLEAWQPTFSAVYPGRITSTRNINIDAIIKSAKHHTSLFSAKKNDSSGEDQLDRSLNKFQAEIKRIVSATREGFATRFNRSMALYGTKGKATISYVGTNLAMNLSMLDPTQNSTYHCAAAQRKITQLLRLRDINIGHDLDELLLGIWVPKKELTVAQEGHMDAYTSELEYAARKANILFEVAYGGDDINQIAKPFAERILTDD